MMRPRRLATLLLVPLTLALLGCSEPRDPEADAAAAEDWCGRAADAERVAPQDDDTGGGTVPLDAVVDATNDLVREPRPRPIEDDLALLAGEVDLEDDPSERNAQLRAAVRRITAYANAVCSRDDATDDDGTEQR